MQVMNIFALLQLFYSVNANAGTWVRNIAQSGHAPPSRDAYAATYNGLMNSIIVAGGVNTNTNTYYNDVYAYSLDTGRWTAITNSAPSWTPVAYINAVYSPSDTSVYIWGGRTSAGKESVQMFSVDQDGDTTVSNVSTGLDSYSTINVGSSLLFYGGHGATYVATLYDLEVSSMTFTSVAAQGTSLPQNTNTIMATTSSINGTFLWFYDGSQNSMQLTRAALMAASGTTVPYTKYTTKTFSVAGLPAWNAANPSMSCTVGSVMYVIQYSQVVSTDPMTYQSFALSFADDSNPVYQAWDIAGTPPPVSSANKPLTLSCAGNEFYAYDSLSGELWGIQVTHSDSTPTVSTTPTDDTSVPTIPILPVWTPTVVAPIPGQTTSSNVGGSGGQLNTTAIAAGIIGGFVGILAVCGGILAVRSRKSKSAAGAAAAGAAAAGAQV